MSGKNDMEGTALLQSALDGYFSLMRVGDASGNA